MVGRIVNVVRAGRLGYDAGLRLQQRVAEDVRAGTLADTLLVLEHEPVYTVGIRDKSYTAQEEARLRALGADFCRTNRGGLITFHGPGQLVVYPIMDLKRYQPSVRWYVCCLEKAVIQLCAQFGLDATTSIHTGVWVKDAKVCAMGVHVSRYITSHGLALNCNTDLRWFSHIVPCGIQGKTVTSLTQLLSRDVSIELAFPYFLTAFEEVFQVKCHELNESAK